MTQMKPPPENPGRFIVSEGKKVAWDVRGNGPSDGPEMPDFNVIRQKTRWELIAAFVVCLFALPIAANFFAATANFSSETFLTSVSNSSEISVTPNSANKLKPINLNEIIFQSLPTNGRMSWDQFSESNVEWQFGGSPFLYAEGGAKRSGIARIRTDGKICTVNSWGKKEAVWSVFLENFENYEEGPSSVRIYPGIRDGDDVYYYTDGKNEILDMKKFNPSNDNGCEFRIESLRSSNIIYTKICQIKSPEQEDVFLAKSIDGRTGTVVFKNQNEDSGWRKSIEVTTLDANAYCSIKKK